LEVCCRKNFTQEQGTLISATKTCEPPLCMLSGPPELCKGHWWSQETYVIRKIPDLGFPQRSVSACHPCFPMALKLWEVSADTFLGRFVRPEKVMVHIACMYTNALGMDQNVRAARGGGGVTCNSSQMAL